MSYRWVYFVRPIGNVGPIKIGCTNNVERRLEQVEAWSPARLEVIVAIPGSPAIEHYLHTRFAEYRLHGEWFSAGPRLLEYVDKLIAARRALAPVADFAPKQGAAA